MEQCADGGLGRPRAMLADVSGVLSLWLHLVNVQALLPSGAHRPPPLPVALPAVPCGVPVHVLCLEHRLSVHTQLETHCLSSLFWFPGRMSGFLFCITVAFMIMLIEITTLPGTTCCICLRFWVSLLWSDCGRPEGKG